MSALRGQLQPDPPRYPHRHHLRGLKMALQQDAAAATQTTTAEGVADAIEAAGAAVGTGGWARTAGPTMTWPTLGLFVLLALGGLFKVRRGSNSTVCTTGSVPLL